MKFLLTASLYIRRLSKSKILCDMCQVKQTLGYGHLLKRYSIYTSQETIFALSSGNGKCGVAVIRVSGAKAAEAVKILGRFQKLPRPRHAELRTLYDHTSDVPIDKGLVLWFPGPKSFTGEDCAEFQVHGGPAVIAAIATTLGKIPALRQAEAGEFTKRAFMNNKLDLTEIEGLGDLIHAETEAQRLQALRQMEGSLGKLYNEWRSRIIKLTAHIEAFIDFSEDENIEEDVLDMVTIGVQEILAEITNHLHDNRRGERLRSGVRITIIGEPNVGKSSLLNLIVQRPAAIVSSIAGTTRDIIESAVNIGGYPVLLSDTAGLRESDDIIEKEGVRRAIERANNSDLKVMMLSAPDITDDVKNGNEFDIDARVQETLRRLGVLNSSTELQTNYIQDKPSGFLLSSNCANDIIVIVNKCDLVDPRIIRELVSQNTCSHVCAISCTTEEGITELLNVIKSKIENLCGDPLVGNPSLTQARHRQHLTNCVTYMEMYHSYMIRDDVVLAAQSLRKAIREIGKITGKITSEDILDVIFKDFCIGK